jgi:hypothetical protein
MGAPFSFKMTGDLAADMDRLHAAEDIAPEDKEVVLRDLRARAAKNDPELNAARIVERPLNAPDGTVLMVRGPANGSEADWARAAQVAAAKYAASRPQQQPAPAEPKFNPFPNRIAQLPAELIAGGVRGLGSFGATARRILGFDNAEENEQTRRDMDAALTELTGIPDLPDLWGYGGAKLATEVAGTFPLAKGVATGIGALSKIAPKATPLIEKAAEGAANFGFRAPGATAPTGAIPKVVDALARATGASTAGGVTAGAIDPKDTGFGATVGAVAAPVIGLVGAGGRAAKGALWDSWHPKAQVSRAASLIGTEIGDDLANVTNNLRHRGPDIVPGAPMDSVSASGSAELAALNRTMQSASTRHAANLQKDAWARNVAYNEALEKVSGNPGRIAVLKAERDAATDPMREQILAAAGRVNPKAVTRTLEDKIAGPSAGDSLYESTMEHFLNRIQKRMARSKDGLMPAEELYAIRKDIGNMRAGKLTPSGSPAVGDGVKRHSSAALDDVQSAIDDVIESASKARINANERIGSVADGVTNQKATPTWKGYLEEYSGRMRELEAYEKMADVWRRIKGIEVAAGESADSALAAKMLNPAKLSRILENEGAELGKVLQPDQLQLLRNILGDAQARAQALSAGKATASNTAQNFKALEDLELSIIRQAARGGSKVALGLDALRDVARGRVQSKVSEALREPDEMLKLIEAYKKAGKTPPLSLNSPGPFPRLTARVAPLLGNRDQ